MGWKEYYELKPQPIGGQRELYLTAIKSLNRQVPILEEEIPKVFILGGFHPSNDTPNDFMDLCREIHPNIGDRHIFLDMNSLAVTNPAMQKFPYVIQARVEFSPLIPNSVDFVVMDYTADFMSDDQLTRFGEEADRILTLNGIVLMITRKAFRSGDYQLDTKLENRFRTHHVDICLRHPLTTSRLLSSLKPILYLPNRDNLLAFSRAESEFIQKTNLLIDIDSADPKIARLDI